MITIPTAVKKPSLWIAIISGGAALAQVLTSIGEPHLAMAGMILSAIFKVAEASQDAYVGGKKLDLEKQFVSTTGNASPTVVAAAMDKGIKVEFVNPSVKLDGEAPAQN